MIVWGEKKRAQDPWYFARIITRAAMRDVWIVSDARRPTDIQYFKVECINVIHKSTAHKTIEIYSF